MHGESVRLDSGLSLPVEEVARGVEAVNDHIRAAVAKDAKMRGEESGEEGELCSMLTLLAFGAAKC